ncbi:MAG: asparaginase [Burkholderiaceae bacterium]
MMTSPGRGAAGWQFIQYLYFHPASRKMQRTEPIVVILGTGGTIAGMAKHAADNVGYTAAQIGVAQLLAAVPALTGQALEAEQICQIDSKDMDFPIWRTLAESALRHLARPEVAGLVITHGTDTLEESAYFLQRVLAPNKPVVFTAAMRPATALLADGPQNLLDAVRVARSAGARGVLAVLAGEVHSALDVRKTHTYRLAAFGSGDAGVIAQIEEGRLRQHRAWPAGAAFGVDRLPADAARWPWVEIVTSHAGARAALVESLCQAGVRGIVAACTGNGSLHHELEAALGAAQASGVRVVRSSRCLEGAVIAPGGQRLPSAGALTPVQARVEMILGLLEMGPP